MTTANKNASDMDTVFKSEPTSLNLSQGTLGIGSKDNETIRSTAKDIMHTIDSQINERIQLGIRNELTSAINNFEQAIEMRLGLFCKKQELKQYTFEQDLNNKVMELKRQFRKVQTDRDNFYKQATGSCMRRMREERCATASGNNDDQMSNKAASIKSYSIPRASERSRAGRFSLKIKQPKRIFDLLESETITEQTESSNDIDDGCPFNVVNTTNSTKDIAQISLDISKLETEIDQFNDQLKAVVSEPRSRNKMNERKSKTSINFDYKPSKNKNEMIIITDSLDENNQQEIDCNQELSENKTNKIECNQKSTSTPTYATYFKGLLYGWNSTPKTDTQSKTTQVTTKSSINQQMTEQVTSNQSPTRSRPGWNIVQEKMDARNASNNGRLYPASEKKVRHSVL